MRTFAAAHLDAWQFRSCKEATFSSADRCPSECRRPRTPAARRSARSKVNRLGFTPQENDRMQPAAEYGRR